MKPLQHAKISAKKHGGKWEDYIDLHNFFDQTKAHIPDMRHRAILHNAFGIFLCEQQFGAVRTNSAGREYSVRDIGEDHVLEDLGTIPTIHEVISCISTEHLQWLGGLPKSTKQKKAKKTLVRKVPKTIPEPEKLTGPIEYPAKDYSMDSEGKWKCNECGGQTDKIHNPAFLSHSEDCSVLKAAEITPEKFEEIKKNVEAVMKAQMSNNQPAPLRPSRDEVIDGGTAGYRAYLKSRRPGFRGSTID